MKKKYTIFGITFSKFVISFPGMKPIVGISITRGDPEKPIREAIDRGLVEEVRNDEQASD